MIYILGLMTGLLLAIVVQLATTRYQKPIERTFKQLQNNFKEKGEIFEESDDIKDFADFIDSLPKE